MALQQIAVFLTPGEQLMPAQAEFDAEPTAERFDRAGGNVQRLRDLLAAHVWQQFGDLLLPRTQVLHDAAERARDPDERKCLGRESNKRRLNCPVTTVDCDIQLISDGLGFAQKRQRERDFNARAIWFVNPLPREGAEVGLVIRKAVEYPEPRDASVGLVKANGLRDHSGQNFLVLNGSLFSGSGDKGEQEGGCNDA
jgi:hypothetical protein